jgi:hypothetical protein
VLSGGLTLGLTTKAGGFEDDLERGIIWLGRDLGFTIGGLGDAVTRGFEEIACVDAFRNCMPSAMVKAPLRENDR